FYFHDPSASYSYTLSLHDALPICVLPPGQARIRAGLAILGRIDPAERLPGDLQVVALLLDDLAMRRDRPASIVLRELAQQIRQRSEEHTSELQSLAYLVCRLLLEK